MVVGISIYDQNGYVVKYKFLGEQTNLPVVDDVILIDSEVLTVFGRVFDYTENIINIKVK